MGGGRQQGVNDCFDEHNGRTTDSSELNSSKPQPPWWLRSHCTMLLTLREEGMKGGKKKLKKICSANKLLALPSFPATIFCNYSEVSDRPLLIPMTIRSFCKSYSFYLHCWNSKARLESEPCSVSQATRTELVHTRKSYQYKEGTGRGRGKQHTRNLSEKQQC